MHAPLYTPANCSNPAYQLDWSYTIFWKAAPADANWLDELTRMKAADGIRILQHAFKLPNRSQFLISTKPHVSPLLVAQRVKGRLQRLLRDTLPGALRRNYSLRSIGSTRRDKLDAYLASQIEHHPMADPRVQERLQRYQVHDPAIDLSVPRATSHAR